MIIGFLGKGGSGKTTLSTALVNFLHKKGDMVLAVDADHNMDLAYNLGITEDIPYLGGGMSDMKDMLNLEGHYRAMFAALDENAFNPPFSITEGNEDEFTKAYSREIKPGLRIMAAGPHDEEVLHGNHCSHSLSAPLRTYLPLIGLADDEHIVVDEKAGRDGAGTGTPSGFDMTFIATEPTLHGMKAAGQIAEILDFLETPYEFVLNKSEERHMDESWNEWNQFLNKKPVLRIRKGDFQIEDVCMEKLLDIAKERIREEAKNVSSNNPVRYARSIRKFRRQKEFIDNRNA